MVAQIETVLIQASTHAIMSAFVITHNIFTGPKRGAGREVCATIMQALLPRPLRARLDDGGCFVVLFSILTSITIPFMYCDGKE